MSTTLSFQHINLQYLDTMTGGDAEMMQQMLDMLTDEIPTELAKMREAATSADWEEIFQISHKLKTTLAFIGNANMVSLNGTIEHCTRHKVSLDEVPALVEQLSDAGVPVVDELNTVRL